MKYKPGDKVEVRSSRDDLWESAVILCYWSWHARYEVTLEDGRGAMVETRDIRLRWEAEVEATQREELGGILLSFSRGRREGFCRPLRSPPGSCYPACTLLPHWPVAKVTT